MEEALRTVENLLRKYGHTYQANLAMIAGEQFARSPAETCRSLNDDEWWGGRDSVAASDLAVDGGFSSEARADGKRLREALIDIYATMKANGQRHEQAEVVIAQFNKWLRSHV
jgi:hypothetical protein